MSTEGSTVVIDRSEAGVSVRTPRFSVQVIEGPDEGRCVDAEAGQLTIGTADGVHLRLSDPTVSRFHAELVATADGIVLRDLDSTNGTRLVGVRLGEVVLTRAAEFRVGKSKLRLELANKHALVEASEASRFGAMIGGSPAMRQIYRLLERAAPTTAPVLITGESGTGKELAARAVHDKSGRKDEVFEIVDCGGLPPTLIESELFGHTRGAFTNAHQDRVGAFQRADGGTLFLDELGELPLELQPKLLRALGEGEVRQIGSHHTQRVDVRVVAATNRDLRREVNKGTFRADLYYRLAVIQVPMPALRERLEDLPMLVPALLDRIAEDRGVNVHIEPDQALFDSLAGHAWPGNVRELRNYLEHLVVLQVAPTLTASGASAPSADTLSCFNDLPLRIAKTQLIEQFERQYIRRLLDEGQGNVAEAARRAGVDRGTLFRTLRRYKMKVDR